MLFGVFKTGAFVHSAIPPRGGDGGKIRDGGAEVNLNRRAQTEKHNVECRSDRRECSMPWFAILCGLSKEHRRKEHGMEQGEGSRKGKERALVIDRFPSAPTVDDCARRSR
jgi:hypothetical protein